MHSIAEHFVRLERLAAQQHVPELGEERQRALRFSAFGFAKRVGARLFVQPRDLRRTPRISGATNAACRTTDAGCSSHTPGFVRFRTPTAGARSSRRARSGRRRRGASRVPPRGSGRARRARRSPRRRWGTPRRTPRRANPRRSSAPTRRFVLRHPWMRDAARPRAEANGRERGTRREPGRPDATRRALGRHRRRVPRGACARSRARATDAVRGIRATHRVFLGDESSGTGTRDKREANLRHVDARVASSLPLSRDRKTQKALPGALSARPVRHARASRPTSRAPRLGLAAPGPRPSTRTSRFSGADARLETHPRVFAPRAAPRG